MQQRNRIYLDDILLFYQVTKHEEEGFFESSSVLGACEACYLLVVKFLFFRGYF
jgi:hypothetical protein